MTNTPDIEEDLKTYIIDNIALGGELPSYCLFEYSINALNRAILIQFQDEIAQAEDNVSPISHQRYLIAAREEHPKTAMATAKIIRDYLHRKEGFTIGGVQCSGCYADTGITRIKDEDSRLYIVICYFIFILREDV